MIKLAKLNKYFNYKSRNEIHVINNVNLEFPDTGLVCLLGPSGSGKTTLLNVIGGLDKANSGVIEIDGKLVNRYKESTWNYYRNHKFGYIFQNYLLLPNMNVYQNLEFSLKVFNLPKDLIEERIDYALKAVGMEKYKFRKPTELSGGQQQRVSIARALIKSPDVYMADEPTGNIDEKNTTQIMNILKKISKNSLIILVTHERRIADFYGDRIIEIKDGEVLKDYLNLSKTSLDTIDDNNIYLKEFDNEASNIKDVDVSYFYKGKDNNEKLKLNIIYRNNTFYIQSNDDSVNIKFLDKHNEIKVIDSKKPVFDINYVEKTEYNLPKININKNKRTSVLRFKDIFKMSMNSIRNLRLIQKIMLFIFFLAAIFLTFGITSYNASSYVDETTFLQYHRNSVQMDARSRVNSLQDLNNLSELVGKDYLLPNHTYMRVPYVQISEFYQRQVATNIKAPTIYPLDQVKKIDLKYGRLPENVYELVMDLHLAKQLLDETFIKNKGIKRVEQLIGITYYETSGIYSIVGIIDNNNPVCYMTTVGYKVLAISRTLFLVDFMQTYARYDDFEVGYLDIYDGYDIEATTKLKDLKLEENQIVVSRALRVKNQSNTLKINNIEFDIVGTFNYGDDEIVYLQNHQLDLFYNSLMVSQSDLYIISDSKTEIVNKLVSNNIYAVDRYELDYKTNVVLDRNSDALFYAAILVIFTLVFLYFIMRSSVASKVYTIGVFRSLGVSKGSVVKIFLLEILLITILSSMVGIVLFSIVIIKVNSVASVIYYPWYVPTYSFAITLVLNTLIGLLPVLPYLRQTPSQILSRFDM